MLKLQQKKKKPLKNQNKLLKLFVCALYVYKCIYIFYLYFQISYSGWANCASEIEKLQNTLKFEILSYKHKKIAKGFQKFNLDELKITEMKEGSNILRIK